MLGGGTEVYMSKVYACIADGLEEVECLAVVDLLRRAGVEVCLASMNGKELVTGSHKITIKADELWSGDRCGEFDMIFLPGGMPGTLNLGANEELCGKLKEFRKDSSKRLAAICAAPSVLGVNGCLEGLNATCYPGFEDKLTGAKHTSAGVVTDGNVTTARGLGFAVDLGLELVKLFKGEEEMLKLKDAIQYS